MPKAFVLLNTDVSAENEVLEELQSYEEVVNANLVYGVYDIIAEVESDSFDDIKQGILEQIRSIEKIRSTVTMIVAEKSE